MGESSSISGTELANPTASFVNVPAPYDVILHALDANILYNPYFIMRFSSFSNGDTITQMCRKFVDLSDREVPLQSGVSDVRFHLRHDEETSWYAGHFLPCCIMRGLRIWLFHLL